jgi:hypothetical protein
MKRPRAPTKRGPIAYAFAYSYPITLDLGRVIAVARHLKKTKVGARVKLSSLCR